MKKGTAKITILIIDDEDEILEEVKSFFSEEGFSVLCANSGEKGMQLFKRHNPDVLLLDLKLPRKSGHEVLEWLRQQHTLKRLPVVVLTASSESSDINRAYDLGANSYLVKPVTFDALVEMVKTLNLYWLILNKRAEVIHE